MAEMTESMLQEEALRTLQRLEQRLENDESSNAPAGQPPTFNPQSNATPTASVHAEEPDMLNSTENEPLTSSTTLAASKMIPSWMSDAKQRFELVFAAPDHKSVVALWLQFEELLGYPVDRKIRLTNQLRPQQLSDWMQRHRLWDKAPPVEKASEFGAVWKGWWKALQPEWRIAGDGSWPLIRDGPAGEVWSKLLKGGSNRFVLVLLSLSWWMMREKDETRKTAESSSALDDVEWALNKMVQMLRAQREQKGDEGESVSEDPNMRPMKR
jgi:hypothetical protein